MRAINANLLLLTSEDLILNLPAHSTVMKQIALYGKGGIGKSTTSANLSAALSLAGNESSR